jgi:hypothetical protein
MTKKLINNTTLSDREFQRARNAYSIQKSSALNRKDRNGNPIEWLFTFETWIDLWLKSGHWHQRGKGRGQYCMSRFGDVGPYAPWNVEIKTVGENNSERNKGFSEETRKKMREAKQGILKSEETRKKMREAKQGISKLKLACGQCGKLCAANMLSRWHNENCRHKKS